MPRFAAVRCVAPRVGSGAAPPGVPSDRFVLALLEDVVEVLSDLRGVTGVLAVEGDDDQWRAGAQAVVWPDTPVVSVAAAGPPGDLATLAALGGLGADEGLVVAADVPDLPALLLAKLFSGLADAEVAACPADGGGLVALACRLPLPRWLAPADTGLDSPDALEQLRAAAPSTTALVVGPGWHRLRVPTDVGRLDPGLEGWAATRALLSGRPN